MSSRNNESGLLGRAFRSAHLIAARAMSCRDWENPKTIKLARRLAHEGATTAQIINALGWEISPEGAIRRLRKYNIRPLNKSRRRHNGLETTFPEDHAVSMASFRPKTIEAKQKGAIDFVAQGFGRVGMAAKAGDDLNERSCAVFGGQQNARGQFQLNDTGIKSNGRHPLKKDDWPVRVRVARITGGSFGTLNTPRLPPLFSTEWESAEHDHLKIIHCAPRQRRP